MNIGESMPTGEPLSIIHVTYINLIDEAIDDTRLKLRTSVMFKDNALEDFLFYKDKQAANDVIRANVAINEARINITRLTNRRNLVWLGALAQNTLYKNT